ncbi:glutamate--cysteine ligase [Acaricomes phytoseiuli]|uniref:glutamate--cysteine ligase n=1 Tax=Acaricomes phytoseiuli TaxID=291968 RepID=UPI00222136C5|nr:glutamate--cysteine ligase [Acaricomes phytoseiuli]MCW1250112.1 glutamate--cysteine ligase [Acaricomes phytoseiuli]
MNIPFEDSPQSTLGVEWELAIVDRASGELVPRADDLLVIAGSEHAGASDEHPHIKRELLLNTIELVTDVCRSTAEATEHLSQSLATARRATDQLGLELMCAGSHPFSHPQAQAVTDKERYTELIERTQWWGAQMVIFGVHIHVGLDSVHKAMPVLDGLVNYVPHFQALSASSPYWNGEDTGYASQRALMFQQLPTAGLPFQFPDWAGYESCVADMLATGAVEQLNEIRWDIRPVANLGTIEMRVCDGLSTLEEVGAIAALTQCLVQSFSDELDAGRSVPTMPPWHVQENKWRAARYGLDTTVILDAQSRERPLTDDLYDLLNRLEPVAAKLGCSSELSDVARIIERGAGYQRQREIAAAHDGDLGSVVQDLVGLLRHGYQD